MALYRVQIRKAINNTEAQRKWSNLYFVDAASASAAAGTGVAIWQNHESVFHDVQTFAYEVYASSAAEGDTDYAIVAIEPGDQRAVRAGGGDILPLWNVIRVDLLASSGRPSRKFFRLPIRENDVGAAAVLNTTLVTLISTSMTSLLVSGVIVDESGQGFTSISVRGLTSKRLGKFSGVDVPAAPAFG